jgi:quinol monooxygenase YgiN
MTAPMPGHQQGPGVAAAALAAPVTLVLSRAVKAGHEQAFEDVLHRLAAEVRRQPGHLDLTVLAPQPGGPSISTIVSHFADRAAADAWLASQERAQLVAEADLHTAGDLQTRYLSGLEGWLAQPVPQCWCHPPAGRSPSCPPWESCAAGGRHLPARPTAVGASGVGPAADLRCARHPAHAVRGDASAHPRGAPVPLPASARTARRAPALNQPRRPSSAGSGILPSPVPVVRSFSGYMRCKEQLRRG